MGDAPRSEIQLCGELAVRVDGRNLTEGLQGGQARSVLAYLVANRERSVDRGELIELLWPHTPPKDPQADLRPILSRLRRALGPAELEGRQRLRLRLPEPVEVDLDQARAALSAARESLDDADLPRAEELASLARGRLQAGLLVDLDGDWIEEQRRAVEDLELEALEIAAEAALAQGGPGTALAERHARELVDRSPYRESGYRTLMEALAAGGNVAEALRVYEQLRVMLRDDLGTTPAAALAELHARLLETEPASSPPAASQDHASPLPAALSPRQRSLFVGREHELRTLEAAWDRVAAGGRELTLVCGQPGIGKTRLVSEFAVGAHRDGSVLYAACPAEPVLPYQPVVEAIRHHLLTRSDQPDPAHAPAPAALVELIPELAGRSQAAEGPDVDPETRRYMLFDGVASVLASAGGGRPLLLVLDDLHWADRPTLDLLRHLLSSPRPFPLLLVGTYRDAEVDADHPLHAVADDARRTGGQTTLRLQGLGEDEVAELITTYAGSAAPAAVLRSVHAGTEGNPFFVEEVVRHLIETDALFADGGRWVSALADDIGVPAEVEEVLRRRISRLSASAGEALGAASVLGREFSFALLSATSGIEEERLIEALGEAVTAQLIVEGADETGQAAYAFTHALVRETLYRGIAAPRRRRLHERAARAIERIEPAGDARLAALAVHLRMAGDAADPDEAVRYSVEAGMRARDLLAWEDAVAHWEGALKLLAQAEGDPVVQLRLLIGVADLMQIMGKTGRQIDFLERALGLAERTGDPERAAQIRSRLGMAYSWEDSIYADVVDLHQAFRHFEVGASVLEQGPPRAARGHLHVGISTAQTFGMRTEEGRLAGERAMEVADELGDEVLWIAAAEAWAWHRIAAGHLGEGLEMMERTFELASQRRSPLMAWLASNMSGQLIWGLGDPDRAQGFLERAMRVPQIERTSYRQTLADGIGRCHFSRGELTAARDLMPDAKPTWFTHSLEPLIDVWDGRWDEVDALARKVLTTSSGNGNRWDEFAAEHHLGRLRALREDHVWAVESLERSLEIVVDGSAVYFELWVLTDLVRSLAHAGRLDEARERLARCDEIMSAGEDWRGRAALVQVARGVVLGRAGETEAAAKAFEAAVETLRAFRLVVEEAEALHEWGHALLQSGDDRAPDRLDASLELLRGHEAGAPLIARTEQLRGRC